MKRTGMNDNQHHNTFRDQIVEQLSTESTAFWDYAGKALNSGAKTVLLIVSFLAVKLSSVAFKATEFFDEKAEKTLDNIPAHS